MLTAIGKYLRKLRIDRGEILKNMADKLGVTASYLSAVENGKRPFPDSWIDTLVRLYELDENSRNEMASAGVESANTVKIDLGNTDGSQKNLAFAFARRFGNLNDDERDRIRQILEGKK